MPERDKFIPKPNLPLGKYRHYKGGEYEVLMLVCDESSHEWLVIYRALYHTGENPDTWARTYENFTEFVYIDGQKTARFKMM